MIKIKKFYFNERGSILLLVIMVASILLLLGFTAMTVSLSAYKMRKVESVAKKNFHIAEAISQESEMKVDEYIKEYLDNSYEEIAVYIEKNEAKYKVVEVEEKNAIFKDEFKDQIITLKSNIEDVESYNLKIIEKYDIAVTLILEDLDIQEDIEGFDMSIISLFKEQNIEEKVKIKYRIDLPEYNDFKQNKKLIKKMQWLNYKW